MITTMDALTKHYITVNDRHYRIVPPQIDTRILRRYLDDYGIAWEIRTMLGELIWTVDVTTSEMNSICRDMQERGAWR